MGNTILTTPFEQLGNYSGGVVTTKEQKLGGGGTSIERAGSLILHQKQKSSALKKYVPLRISFLALGLYE